MRRWFLWAFLFISPSLWGQASLDLESPFTKILLIKNEKGEIQKKIAKKTSSVDGNVQGESEDGVVYVVAKGSLVAVLPVCPNEGELFSSKSIQEAIQLLERTSEDLKSKAEITPRIMVRWDQVLKESKAREEKLALEDKRINEAREKEEKEKRGEDTAAWLKEAKDFMKPRTEGEISVLMRKGGDLKKGSSGEIEEYLAVLSQVLPKEKGGPLPDLQKLSEIQPEILSDDMLIWFAGGVYLVSLFLLLFGLSYLSNTFVYIQSKFWVRAIMYGLLAPLFFVALYYLWWPPGGLGQKIEPSESESFKELDVFVKNQLKPVYYFPPREFLLPQEEVVAGFLKKLVPTDKLQGFLKGHMENGELSCGSGRWSWSQGISVLGLPLGIPLQFEGPIPELAYWASPKIDRVRLGQIKLPKFLASTLEDAMTNTFRNALQATALQSFKFARSGDGMLLIQVPASGVRPSVPVYAKKEEALGKKEIRKDLKKEITAEELAKDYLYYQDRLVYIEGYVKRVDSGGEFSGDSKAFEGYDRKPMADKVGGQMQLDRFDEFELESWNRNVRILCKIKSKSVFTMDGSTSSRGDDMDRVPGKVVLETGEPLVGGDVYWGPRANRVHDEPLIKRGQRARFLTPGRVDVSERESITYVNVMGVRVDESSQISCYDPHQEIDFAPLKVFAVGDPDFDLSATAISKLPVRFESSDPSVAEIYKGNRVKIKAPGETTITAIQDGNYSWIKASRSQLLTVEPSK